MLKLILLNNLVTADISVGQGPGARTWCVGDSEGSKRLWLRHDGLLQSLDGTHRSAEPVSKHTVTACDGVPSSMLP